MESNLVRRLNYFDFCLNNIIATKNYSIVCSANKILQTMMNSLDLGVYKKTHSMPNLVCSVMDAEGPGIVWRFNCYIYYSRYIIYTNLSRGSPCSSNEIYSVAHYNLWNVNANLPCENVHCAVYFILLLYILYIYIRAGDERFPRRRVAMATATSAITVSSSKMKEEYIVHI